MHENPNILQILPKLHQTGGVERGTLEIAAYLQNIEWGSFVASQKGELLPKLKHIGAQHIQMALDAKDPTVIGANIFRLQKAIKENKINIVHARSRAPAWSAYFAAKRAKVPFITTFHGLYGLENKWKKKYNSVMLKGEKVIAVSEFIKQHILENYEIDESKIRVIHRGVDSLIFSPEKTSEHRIIELYKKWQIPEHLPVILFPGRITRWKGQDYFIKALAQLSTRDFFAVLVGDDTQHPQFKKEIVDLITASNLEGNVRIVGSTAHMSEAYKLAKIVVATSIDPEAFGRVALEAQAMGKPVIATNHGGAKETVKPGITGWLVEPRGVDALAKTIDEALQADSDKFNWMSAEAIKNSQNFTTEVMCKKTIEVYKEVLDNNKTNQIYSG